MLKRAKKRLKNSPSGRQGNEDRRKRKIMTPEGVALEVTLASRGERAVALILDFVVMFIIILILALLTGVVVSATGFSSSLIFVMLAYFVLRSFYFALFELNWQGQTPGKRIVKIRVIKRSGGRLDTGAIFSRNLMREVELFLPLSVIFANEQVGAGTFVVILMMIWTGVMLFMPFFNRDYLRVGDIVGGTWVIAAPKHRLLPEVGHHAGEVAENPPLHFTNKQLEVYGIYELQTLETVLRRDGMGKEKLLKDVAVRIKEKIGWSDKQYHENANEFLQGFYSALRQHLEGHMLMGKRKEDKFDGVNVEAPAVPNPIVEKPQTEERPKAPIKNPLYKAPSEK